MNINEEEFLRQHYRLVPWREMLESILLDVRELPFTNIAFKIRKSDGELTYKHKMYFSCWGELVSLVINDSHPPKEIHIGPRHINQTNVDGHAIKCGHLVADFDAPDTRTCGCGAEKKICQRCWSGVVLPAAKRLVRFFQEKPISAVYCVFSGRRGVHVWACDEFLPALSETERLNLLRSTGEQVDMLPGKMNHLCRLPYSPHVGTGFVAVPFDPFDPRAEKLSFLQVKLGQFKPDAFPWIPCPRPPCQQEEPSAPPQ